MKKSPIVASLLTVFGGVGSVHAGQWIDPDDTQLRHHVQLLADSGAIQIPITTWPMMWSGVGQALRQVDTATLSNQQQDAYQYVMAAYRHSLEDTPHVAVRAMAQGNPGYFGGAADTDREQASLGLSADAVNGPFGWRLQATLVDDPQDGDEFRLDGSYVAAGLGNWTLTAGAVDRWWGPAWQDSLILSNSARPVPAISLQRNHPDAFETPLLSWIGPWQLTAFAGQLESDRHISDAKLLGLRFAMRPLKSLELGFSRTAQWGGEGRPQSLESFWDLLIGKDNRGSEGIAEDGSNEPGNQLGALDWRWSFPVSSMTASVYGQVAGEDESGGMPSRFAAQLGVDGAFALHGIHNRVRLEFVDTGGEGSIDTQYNNYIYEHGIYKSGYRYKGRPLGARIDNDSRQFSLAADHYLDDRYAFRWNLSHIELNRDGTNAAPPGGNVLSDSDRTLWFVSLGMTRFFSSLEISAGVDYMSETLTVHGQQIDRFSPKLALEYRF